MFNILFFLCSLHFNTHFFLYRLSDNLLLLFEKLPLVVAFYKVSEVITVTVFDYAEVE